MILYRILVVWLLFVIACQAERVADALSPADPAAALIEQADKLLR
jgi:hypothetical protein